MGLVSLHSVFCCQRTESFFSILVQYYAKILHADIFFVFDKVGGFFVPFFRELEFALILPLIPNGFSFLPFNSNGCLPILFSKFSEFSFRLRLQLIENSDICYLSVSGDLFIKRAPASL